MMARIRHSLFMCRQFPEPVWIVILWLVLGFVISGIKWDQPSETALREPVIISGPDDIKTLR